MIQKLVKRESSTRQSKNLNNDEACKAQLEVSRKRVQ